MSHYLVWDIPPPLAVAVAGDNTEIERKYCHCSSPEIDKSLNIKINKYLNKINTALHQKLTEVTQSQNIADWLCHFCWQA